MRYLPKLAKQLRALAGKSFVLYRSTSLHRVCGSHHVQHAQHIPVHVHLKTLLKFPAMHVLHFRHLKSHLKIHLTT